MSGCVHTTVGGAICNADTTHRLRKRPDGLWFHLCPTHVDTVESILWRSGDVDKEALK